MTIKSDPMDVDSLLLTGREVVSNTYRGVNNDEVRDMLSIGFPEMSSYFLVHSVY